MAATIFALLRMEWHDMEEMQLITMFVPKTEVMAEILESCLAMMGTFVMEMAVTQLDISKLDSLVQLIILMVYFQLLS